MGNINPVLTPGQRLLTVKGCDAAEKYPMPRDCHAHYLMKMRITST